MTILFQEEYSSESLYDLMRDVLECFNPDFNEIANQIDENSFIKVTFTYSFLNGDKIVLLNRIYSQDDCVDSEDDLHQSLEKVDDQKDKHGFHPGTFDLVISIS